MTRTDRFAWVMWLCGLLLMLSGCSAAMERTGAAPAMSPAEGMAYPGAQPMPAPPADMADNDADGMFTEREEAPMRPEGLVLNGMAGAPPPPPPPPPVTTPAPAPQGGETAQPKPKVAQASASTRGPILIYTAQITMAVFEVQAALAQIEELAKELGGFLARRDDNAITIRVPAALFDTAIRRIEKTGDMLTRNVVAQDVTEEFRDLELRIRNARAVRDRLEQLLAKATKVEESVMVERELERVSGELERMEGRLKFLKDRAAYSTITVTYQPKRREELTQTPFRLPVYWLNELGLSRLLSL